MVITPTDVIKRREQSTRNRIDRLYEFTFKSLSRTYTLGLLKNGPKTVLKYAIYEILLNILRHHFQLDLAGALSAMIATLGTTTLFTPLDVLKTHVSLGKSMGNGTRIMYRGLVPSLTQSIIGNGLGHFILERFAPRR